MDAAIYDDKTFENLAYAEKTVGGKEFEACTFKKCDLSNSDFSHNRFTDCKFEGCNLSMINLTASTLNYAVFRHCKIVGVDFSKCDDFLFSVRFEDCILDYASFFGRNMVKTNFIKTSLKEVNFEEANLSGSIFAETDLSGAVFNRSNLAAANFASAFNYAIDPELNTIKKATFSADGLPGLLTRYNIKIV